MRDERICITRYIWQDNKINEQTFLAYQVTRNHKISFKWEDNHFKYSLINLDPKFVQTKKMLQQGLNLSNVLNFTFREAATSINGNKIYEMFCFSDQKYIAFKVFNRRISKIINKKEKKSNETSRSNENN